MKKLPPLNAIKAFEAAARSGSFTQAADELGVSSAAVSQQVRNLETWFGKPLFIRNGNRITMTDAGHEIYPQTSRALDDIASVAGRVLEGEVRPRLVVACMYAAAVSARVANLTAQPFDHAGVSTTQATIRATLQAAEVRST
jgi:LysR family transcriptional regulator, glycine cleavage system transcriptional activator